MKKVVKKLKPGKIIPIHTFYPDKYGGLFDRKIEQISDGEVLWCEGEFILLFKEGRCAYFLIT